MGQAKLRKLANQNFLVSHYSSVEKVARAVMKLAIATSSANGMDCLIHAGLGQTLLKQHFGLETEMVIGYAAWRVGEGDGDVISHIKESGGSFIQGMPAMGFHAWLEAGDHIMDLTTYQLPKKCVALDEMDGGQTSVDWAPEFLFVPKQAAKSHKEVAQGHAGLFFYEPNKRLGDEIMSRFKMDEEDVALAETVLSMGDIMVMGPCNTGEGAIKANSD